MHKDYLLVFSSEPLTYYNIYKISDTLELSQMYREFCETNHIKTAFALLSNLIINPSNFKSKFPDLNINELIDYLAYVTNYDLTTKPIERPFGARRSGSTNIKNTTKQYYLCRGVKQAGNIEWVFEPIFEPTIAFNSEKEIILPGYSEITKNGNHYRKIFYVCDHAVTEVEWRE